MDAEDTRPGIPAPLDDGECDRLAATLREQAAAPVPCDHHFASIHEPGHVLYWVRQCTLCHEVDWDDLDREIRDQVAAERHRGGQAGATLALIRSLCGEGAPAVAVDRIEAILGTQERDDEKGPTP